VRETETNKHTHTQLEKKHGDPTEKKKFKKYISTRRERVRGERGCYAVQEKRERKDEKREMGWMRRNGTTLVDAVDAR
jgi:hypothetical protein